MNFTNMNFTANSVDHAVYYIYIYIYVSSFTGTIMNFIASTRFTNSKICAQRDAVWQ